MGTDNIYDLFSSANSLQDPTFNQITDLLASSDVDISQLSNEEIEQLINMSVEPEQICTEVAGMSEVSFTGTPRCSWCGGSGYVWWSGENVICSHCGGSGIGS